MNRSLINLHLLKSLFIILLQAYRIKFYYTFMRISSSFF